MRKTKILKRLVATTFALALVLSGIIPGMEPLEVQAESVTITTQISTEERCITTDSRTLSFRFFNLPTSYSGHFATFMLASDQATTILKGSTYAQNAF